MIMCALLAATGCLSDPGDNLTGCGPMPDPVPMVAHQVTRANQSMVEIDTTRWYAHESWVASMLDWAACMDRH